MLSLVREIPLFLVVLERAGPHQITAFHSVMELRAGQGVPFACLTDCQTGAEPGRVGRAEGVGIESGARANPACACPARAKMHSNGIIHMARHDPDRSTHHASLIVQLDYIREYLTMFTAPPANPVGKTETLRCGGAEQGRVVPGELRQRLG